MSLRRIERRRVPLDRWFRTTARLNSILRAMANYNDDAIELPKPHQRRGQRDDGARLGPHGEVQGAGRRGSGRTACGMGPVIRIGTMDSPEVVMHGYHHYCGLFHDYTLDGDPDDREDGGWIYCPFEATGVPRRRRERVRVRQVRQAPVPRRLRPPHAQLGLPDGRRGRVPRLRVARPDRPRRGAGADQGVPASRRLRRTASARPAMSCGRSSAACEMFERKVSGGGNALQTRLWLDGDWSFSWSTLWFDKEAGEWKRYMHGGFILHGPRPLKNERRRRTPSSSTTTARRQWRNATVEEVARMDWSIHT